MLPVTNSLLLTFCLIGAATAASLPAAQQLRFGRDVSEAVAEPVSNYLPPEVDQSDVSPPAPLNKAVEEDSVVVDAVPMPPAAGDSAALVHNGYEYRIVRKLRYRQRRDVSHLNLGYLPPVDKPRPAKIYLPPHVNVPAPLPKLSNEYLPPVQEDIKTEPITEAPAEEPAASTEPSAEHQDTAIFADDGYHYKKPAVEPNLGPAPEVEAESESEPEQGPEAEPETAPSAEPAPLLHEYLPPLENAVVEAEGSDGESAALHDGGYRYRVVKRARFF